MISEPEALLRLVLAAAAGALVGIDREARDKPAGVRTFSIVALGSTMFSLIGLMTFGQTDAGARIAAQVVTGVGFLGAGTILHNRGNVIGLTTAAGVWGSAAVGMGFGFRPLCPLHRRHRHPAGAAAPRRTAHGRRTRRRASPTGYSRHDRGGPGLEIRPSPTGILSGTRLCVGRYCRFPIRSPGVQQGVDGVFVATGPLVTALLQPA